MYKKMKSMVKASLESFKFSPSGTRGAIVGFGAQSTIALNLKEGTDIRKLGRTVGDLTRIGGPRRMNKALRKIQSDIFANPLYKSPNTKKVVILLTTGKNSGDGTGELPSVALDLRSQGVEVIPVVIGQDKDQQEIDAITGKSANPVYVNNINNLPLALGSLEAHIREAGGIVYDAKLFGLF